MSDIPIINFSGVPDEDQLHEVQRLIARQGDKLPSNWIAQPQPGMLYHEGTFVPVIGVMRGHRRKSGLYVVGKTYLGHVSVYHLQATSV